MKLEYLDPVSPPKNKIADKKTIYDSEPNEETVKAIEDAFKIAKGEMSVKSYKSFEEMWSDICGTWNKTNKSI